MLNAANVLIHWHPIFIALIDHGLSIRSGIAHEIPRGIYKGIHGVSFTTRRLATLWTLDIQEVRTLIEWITTAIRYTIFRQYYWQVCLRHGHSTTTRITLIATMNNRNRRTPIALTRNTPVTQSIGSLDFANAKLFKFFRNSTHCLFMR